MVQPFLLNDKEDVLQTAPRAEGTPLTNGLNLNPASLFCIFPITGGWVTWERDRKRDRRRPVSPVVPLTVSFLRMKDFTFILFVFRH